MDKEARLKLLKEIGRRYEERNNLVFGEMPISDRIAQDEIRSTDTFREESRSRNSVKGINSDEK